MSPCKCQLYIRAKTQWGEWSNQPLIVGFEIEPPIWMTKSIQFVTVLVVVGSFVLVFRLKTRKYKKASVLFTDFKGFTKMSTEMSPEKLVQKSDEIFVAFD